MNPLIERYVQEVLRRLPQAEREEVKAKIFGDIQAKLPESPTNADIESVLKALGSPKNIAEQYRIHKRYLISPASFDNYLRFLKFAGFILFITLLIVGLIADIIRLSQAPSIAALVSAIVTTLVESALLAAACAFIAVTLIFALIDQFERKKKEKIWATGDLPKMPLKVNRMSRSAILVSTLISTAFNAAFIFAMVRFPQYIAWYENSKPVAPVFHANVLSGLVPYVVILALAVLLVGIMKLIYGYWNYTLAFLNAAYDLANAAFLVYFFNYTGVFDASFLAKIANAFSIPLDTAASYFEKGIFVLSALIIVGSFWNIAEYFYRAYRNSKIMRREANGI